MFSNYLNKKALSDGYIIVAISILALCLFIATEAFENLVRFSEKQKSWEMGELLTLLMVMPLAFGIYAGRRLGDAKGELLLRTEAESAALSMAFHDPLTGLPNRRKCTSLLEEALLSAGETPVAVLLLDLNRFKATNDLHGHVAGDQLLCEAGVRLTEAGGPGSIVTRQGGDEFVILLKDAPWGDDLIARIATISKVFERPFVLNESTVFVGAAIGVTRVDHPGYSNQAALSQADAAMYRSKQTGKNTYTFFEPGMELVAIRRGEIENDLRDAIAAGAIEPHYQPIVTLGDGEVLGFEVLARWRLEDGSMRMPDEFIEIAEASGLIGDLFYAMMAKVAQDVRSWSPHWRFAVNLSPVQFRDEWLVERVIQILTAAGIAPCRMDIEITENALVTDLEHARTIIAAFKRHGIGVAMDDFGTGYSSLQHLRELQVDTLKIDRSFIHDLAENESSRTIVKAVTAMAHLLGLTVTVEGIDTAVNADLAIEYGCDAAQGYYFGRPNAHTVMGPLPSGTLADTNLHRSVTPASPQIKRA